MLRLVCLAVLIGVCLGWYQKPKPMPKKCYSCEYSPPKMTTKTVFKTQTTKMKVPKTKVHCWYSFEVEGKAVDAQNSGQSDCAYYKPTCKSRTSYKVVRKTRRIPMKVMEMSSFGGFKACRGPINHYNEKKLGVDAWSCYDSCYIRMDAHGRVTRGCFSQLQNVDPSIKGCSMQDGATYCFCDKDRCNGQVMMSNGAD